MSILPLGVWVPVRNRLWPSLAHFFARVNEVVPGLRWEIDSTESRAYYFSFHVNAVGFDPYVDLHEYIDFPHGEDAEDAGGFVSFFLDIDQPGAFGSGSRTNPREFRAYCRAYRWPHFNDGPSCEFLMDDELRWVERIMAYLAEVDAFLDSQVELMRSLQREASGHLDRSTLDLSRVRTWKMPKESDMIAASSFSDGPLRDVVFKVVADRSEELGVRCGGLRYGISGIGFDWFHIGIKVSQVSPGRNAWRHVGFRISFHGFGEFRWGSARGRVSGRREFVFANSKDLNDLVDRFIVAIFEGVEP